MSTSKYGPHLAKPKGWIAKLGNSEFNHKFGGSSWNMLDSSSSHSPTLIAVFDTQDPKLSPLKLQGVGEVPICSHLDCSLWSEKQFYRLNIETKTVIFEPTEIKQSESWNTDLPKPLPEKSIILCEMEEMDYPTSKDRYWAACDRFLSSNFIRVLGPTLWMESEEEVVCSCGTRMNYVCGIGHQSEANGEYVDGSIFYFGEGVLYFFVCHNCLSMSVFPQFV